MPHEIHDWVVLPVMCAGESGVVFVHSVVPISVFRLHDRRPNTSSYANAFLGC